MVNQFFKTQKLSPVDYNGLVTEQHLGFMYMTEPVLIDKVITQLYPIANAQAIQTFMETFPIKEVETENGFYEWMLQGNHEKNVPLLDWYDVNENKPDKAGVGKSQFFLVFPEPYFEEYNVLKSDKQEYQLLVKGVEQIGSNFRYLVELLTGSDEFFMPASLLYIGSRWAKFYNMAADQFSDRGAEANFTSPFRMRNRNGQMRMQYKVTGSMIEQGGNYPLLTTFPNGIKTFINYQDIVTHSQFGGQKANAFMYGLANFNTNDQIGNKSINGKFPMGRGAGFFEQIAPSNQHFFNTLDLDYMTSVIHDLAVGRVSMADREITLMTGEYGLIDFHNAVLAKGGQYVTDFGARTNDKIIYKATGPAGIQNPMGLGAQYTEYYAYNGIKFKLILNPMYDDKVKFPEMHPLGGTVESRRMTVIGFGGEPNVYRVRPKGQAPVMKFIPGMRDPFSPGGSKQSYAMTASPLDGYEVHMMDWTGCMIKDPTRIIDFRVNIDF